MYPITTGVLNDSEGKASLHADDYNGLLTLDGHAVFVHFCENDGQKYYLNNSKTPICHDYKKQIKPIMDQLKGNELIKNISIKHYQDSRFFIDVETDIVDHYDHDTRGSGDFAQHIYIEGALSSIKAWGYGIKSFRLICSNGCMALAKTLLKQMHKTKNFSTNNIILSTQIQFRIFDLLQEVSIPANIRAIMSKLPKKHQDTILKVAKDEGRSCAWSLYNGMTYMLSHMGMDDATREIYENYCREALLAITPKEGELWELIGYNKVSNVDASLATVQN